MATSHCSPAVSGYASIAGQLGFVTGDAEASATRLVQRVAGSRTAADAGLEALHVLGPTAIRALAVHERVLIDGDPGALRQHHHCLPESGHVSVPLLLNGIGSGSIAVP